MTAGRYPGYRSYQLEDHLGNVRVVVADNKSADTSGEGIYLVAKVRSASEYYPFGMSARQMTGEVAWAGGQYRWGYNGKEMDRALGSEDAQDYGFRAYRPEIARFMSVDPLREEYPMLTSYQFASNTPIQAIDLDGLEAYVTIDNKSLGYGRLGKNGQTRIAVSYTILSSKSAAIHTSVLANSAQTAKGRDAVNISPTGIRKLSDDDIGRILAFGTEVIENNGFYNFPTTQTAREESVSTTENGGYGLLDFKFVAYDLLNIEGQQLLEINGVAYNANEAGNYLWGMVLEYNNSLISPNFGAQQSTIRKDLRLDEEHEQKAITEGRNFANNLTQGVRNAYKKYFIASPLQRSQADVDVEQVTTQAKSGQNQVGTTRNRMSPPGSGN